MEETQVHAPKIANGLMIFFLVIGVVFTILGFIMHKTDSLPSIVLWMIAAPTYMLFELRKKTLKAYRTAGIIAGSIVLLGFSQSIKAANNYPTEVFIGVLVFVGLWIIVALNINKAFKKSFPGKKLLDKN